MIFQIRNYIDKSKIMTGAKICFVIVALYFQQIISFSNAFSYVLLALLAIVFWDRQYKSNRWIDITSLILAVCCTFGNLTAYNIYSASLIERYGQNRIYLYNIFIMWYIVAGVVGWYILWQYVLIKSLSVLRKIRIDRVESKEPKKWYIFIPVVAVSGFIFFLPYFLCFFPGILSSDSVQQLTQVVGQEAWSNHHPWIHTLIIKVLYELGGGQNSGIAVYSIWSMLTVSFSFAYVLYVLYRESIKVKWLFLLYLFFYIVPFNAMYAISMWKDVPFSVCLLCFTVFIWSKRNSTIWRLREKIVFCVVSFLICTIRSNGIIIFILCIPFLVCFFHDSRKLCVKMIIIVLILFGLFKEVLMPTYHVQQPDLIEALSVPTQQIAYVITKEGDVSEDELELLDRIMKVEEIPSKYLEYLSDPVKELVRTGDQVYLMDHKFEYFLLWLKIGTRNPGYYIEAWINQTEGYWYHRLDYYWKYHTGINEITELGIKRQCLLSDSIKQFIDLWLYWFDMRIYSQFWSMALSTWTALILWSYAKTHGRYSMPYLPTLFVILSLLIATPVSKEFRYAWSVFLMVPVLLLMTLHENDDDKDSDRLENRGNLNM